MKDVELDFGAISIDNETLKSHGYKFDEGLLKEMCQFKTSPVKVIQSDIVHNEAVKHIGEEITRAKNEIKKALRSAKCQLKIKTKQLDDATNLLSIDGDPLKIADQRIREYYNQIGAELIESNKYLDVDKLMEMYFKTKAPFELKTDKKNEFPDAIALLSLENWAEKHDVNVIAVTKDKGWENYSKNSHRITVISDLAKALEEFQPIHKISKIIEIVNHIRANEEYLEEIGRYIEDSIDGQYLDVDADSDFYYEYDDVFATYLAHQLETDESNLIAIHITHIEEESISLQISATVTCEIHASFDFSVRDSIDRDYFHIGSSNRTIEESYKTDILLELNGDFSQGIEDIEIKNVEVLDTIHHADFGYIEPDYDDDYDN